MNKLFLILPLSLSLCLTSCDFLFDIFYTSNYSSTTTTTTTTTTSYEPTPLDQRFNHVFLSDDFNKEGGNTQINGVNLSYDEFTYLSGYWGYGVQIGSSSNPQKEFWNLTISFNDNVFLKNIEVYVTNAKSGGGVLQISVLDETQQYDFDIENDPQLFSYSGINKEVNEFDIKLKSNKNAAIYLYSISFDIQIKPGSSTYVYSDTYDKESKIPGESDIPNIKYELISIDEYYKNTNLNLTGNDLKNELNKLSTNINYVNYGDAKYILQYTDESLTHPGYMYGLFDGDLIPQNWDAGASWQREHVWACARMNITGVARPTDSTKGNTSDLHNLRVACRGTNQYHSDKYYSSQITSQSLYPNVTHDEVSGIHTYSGDHRGDIARILFYMYVTYDELILTNNSLQMEDDTNSDYIYSMGLLDELLEWNILDPVDEFEMQRNNRIYQYQQNRNPFIDHPSLASSLFD